MLLRVICVLCFISLAQIGRPQKADPATTCKYDPDRDPSQAGPGKQTDGDYDFAYVSDYEAKDQNYRRRICNSTKHRVWFDWGIASLKGWCDTGGVLANEMPYPSEPKQGDGPLLYDLRSTPTRAYIYQPVKSKGAFRSLWSSLSGYVRSGDSLLPVTIGFASEYQNNQFAYTIENRSQESVKVYWKSFSDYWRKRQPKEYADAFERQAKEGVLNGTADAPTIVIKADRKSFWVFKVQPSEVEGQYSEVEIHAPETLSDPKRPDLLGVAALYLPADNSLVGERK
jgi:hypothetical protein